MTEIDFEYECLVLVLNKIYYLSCQSIFKTFVANFTTRFLCVSVCLFLFACLCCFLYILCDVLGASLSFVLSDRLSGSVQWGHHQYLTVEHKLRHDIPTCRDTKTNVVLFFAHFQ